MIVPPTMMARNDRAKLVSKNLCRSHAPEALVITPNGKTVYVASVATCTSVQPPGDVISSAGVRVPSA
jgi:hypothetical protein